MPPRPDRLRRGEIAEFGRNSGETSLSPASPDGGGCGETVRGNGLSAIHSGEDPRARRTVIQRRGARDEVRAIGFGFGGT